MNDISENYLLVWINLVAVLGCQSLCNANRFLRTARWYMMRKGKRIVVTRYLLFNLSRFHYSSHILTFKKEEISNEMASTVVFVNTSANQHLPILRLHWLKLHAVTAANCTWSRTLKTLLGTLEGFLPPAAMRCSNQNNFNRKHLQWKK